MTRHGIYGARACLAGAALAATLLGAAPGWAGTKEDDAAKMVAEWAAIPDGTVAPAVADALAFEAGWGPGPVLQEVVYEMPAQRPSDDNAGYFTWIERASLSRISPTLFKLETRRCWKKNAYSCGTLDTQILDQWGLLAPFGKTLNAVSVFDITKMSALSVTASQTSPATNTAPLPPFSSFASTVDSGGVNPERRMEYRCQVGGVQSLRLDVNCKSSGVYAGVFNIGNEITTLPPTTDQFSFLWNTTFNIYLSSGYSSDACYTDVCGGNSHKIIDYRPAGGDWHSKVVSAALSAPDRARALALFSAGFEAFKHGDFIGAVALLQKGLTIDPANHLAYFALAECARSAWTNNQDDYWEKSVAFYYYRRTVDLAPDSPEGVRAQGRIDGGLL